MIRSRRIWRRIEWKGDTMEGCHRDEATVNYGSTVLSTGHTGLGVTRHEYLHDRALALGLSEGPLLCLKSLSITTGWAFMMYVAAR